MKRALINIDYTFDFVDDQGALTCGKPGQAIHDYLLHLNQEFLKAGDDIVFAIDLHDQDDPFHPETKLFPPHNIRGTQGRDLYGDLETFYQTNRQSPQVHYLDKTRYSAFAGTDLYLRLKERQIQEIHLVGVCTDICVLHTAIDAYNLGFNLVIHSKGVASFNSNGHDWALNHFTTSLGAEVV